MKTRLGCNAIRIYIDPSIDDPNATPYPALYMSVLHHARDDLGMKIYANPLGTGKFKTTNADWATWVAAYANALKPDYLGPFNESGIGASTLADIAQRVTAGLNYQPEIVGADGQKVDASIALLSGAPSLAASFGVVSSHNAVGDEGATADGWTALATAAGKMTWATENPRPWSALNDAGIEVGVKAVVLAPIRGLVLYEAFPSCVAADGSLTAKGTAIAAGVRK